MLKKKNLHFSFEEHYHKNQLFPHFELIPGLSLSMTQKANFTTQNSTIELFLYQCQEQIYFRKKEVTR